MTKVPQNLYFSGERGTPVVCGCIDRAILVSVRIQRGGKFVGPNHFYRDKLSSASGEGLVHSRKGAGAELMADVVMSP